MVRHLPRLIVACMASFILSACAHVNPTPLSGAASNETSFDLAGNGRRSANDPPAGRLGRSVVEGNAPKSPVEDDVARHHPPASPEISESQVVPASAIETSEEAPKSFEPSPVPLHHDAEPLQSALPAPGGVGSLAVMTLDDLQRIALESNPTLRQAAWIVDKARGVRHQVGRYPNPTVGYQGQEMGNDGTAGQQGIFLQQTIVTGEKLRLGEQVLDHEIQALSWQVEAQRLRVLTDLELSYLDALGAQRRMKLADQLVQLAEQGVDVARQLVEAKEGARPDVLQAEILLSEVRIIRRNAQNDYEASWWRLAGIVGRPEMAAVSLAGDIEDEVEPRELERDYERLLAASPELQVAQARVQRAQALVRSQAAQPIPNILAQVGVAHDNSTGDEIAGVQIGLPIPVFNRNRGNIAAAHAEFHRACEDVERLRLALRVRLTRAYQEYIQARNQAELIEREILPRAEESRTLNEQAYRLGEFDFLRVLTARRTYFETNIRYIESLTELHKAAALIDGLLLTGGLDSPDDLSTDDGLRGQTLSNQ